MKLGIYIGSFNPPHKGHIDIVNYLINHHYVDNILIVPTLDYWDKTNLANITDRINMLKFFENEHVKVDTQSNKYVYTIELMKVLESLYPEDELYLIIGADNLLSFDKWKDYKELMKYNIIVMNRNNIDIEDCIKKLGENHFIVVNDYPYLPISSSMVRENLDSEYLDSKVLSYIKKRKLYQSK